MIRTLLRVQLLNLRRDRPAQVLTFLVPVAFFTVFALVFGGRGRGITPRVPVAVVDEAGTDLSRRLVSALEEENGLRVRATVQASRDDTTRVPIDRERALAMVRAGDLPVALVIPAGIDTSIGRWDAAGQPITLLSDPSDPVAPQVVGGLLQRVVMRAAPSAFARQGISQFDRFAGGLTPRQRELTDQWFGYLQGRDRDSTRSAGGGDSSAGSGTGMSGLVRVEKQEVLGRKQDTSMISFFAAGIAVMFLLFSCTGAAGSLLEEVESGTLERVLSSRVGMTGLLAGKWVYLILLGVMQITVMFTYAMLVFRLDLLPHLPGFAVMTVVTSAVAGGFGLVLAALSRSRHQLGGISTLLILTLSALGGSMFPRFLMSEGMQRLGLMTFNAWAIDGYVKVFWREARLIDLAPQVGVLLGFMVVFLVLARLLARRWERG